MELMERITELERRLAAVEEELAAVKRRQFAEAGVTRAIRTAVQAWPGPFTRNDILELVQRAGIKVTPAAVAQRLTQFEKRGAIEMVSRGAGPTPNLYEYTGGNLGAQRRGKHFSNTSGLICALRGALEDLPDLFSIQDAKNWLEARWTGKKPKRLNSYLVALRENGEIEVVRERRSGPDGHCQLYRRAKRYAVTGEELSPAEVAWRELRRTMKTDVADMLTPLERKEEAA